MFFILAILLLGCANTASTDNERVFQQLESLERKLNAVAVATDALDDPVVARKLSRDEKEDDKNLRRDISEIKHQLANSIIIQQSITGELQ